MATSKKKRKKSGSPAPASAPSAAKVLTVAAAPAAQLAEPAQDQTEAEFATEYGYVRKDLRHLAIVSAVLFVVMLGIGFLI